MRTDATDAAPSSHSSDSPPFSLASSHRSPPLSLATGERVGSRADYGKLAAFALAELCDSLGCPCAAIVARTMGHPATSANSPDLWRAIATTVRGMATHDFRRHDQVAAAEAALELAQGEPIAAVLTLSRLNGEELNDWHARVTAEMVSSREQAKVIAHAEGTVSL